ncbi:MAG TPA: tetratricopeptide repeat protein [Verrucomicrobiae bacterium]|jgi:Flp pilus assembly protein TadD
MARPRLIALLLALITLAVYSPVLSHDFVNYDDPDYVSENHIVQNGLTWAGVKWAFTTWYASNWHPLTWLSHMMDCELFGLNAGAHHLTNVLFHTANAILLLALLLRLTGALWPSAFVAALFAWHPLHVESVAWISERKDVLSTFFGLLTLLSYTRFAEESKVQSPKSKVFYALALFFFALGLMAKPMLVTLPFVMLLLDYWPLKRVEGYKLKIEGSKVERFQPLTFNLQLLTEKFPFFLLSSASCIVTFFAQRAGESVLSLRQYPLSLRLGNAPMSYALYLWKMIWPAKLAIIYPLQNHLPWAAVSSAVIFLIAVSWLAWRARRQFPWLPVGWFWFLGTLVPVIGLMQTGTQALADRYTYFPLIGIFIAVAWAAKDLIARFQIKIVPPAAAAVLILAGCLILTEHQLGFWQNDETLFGHAVAVTENNDVARVNFGVALEKQGRDAEALANYREALRINPRSVQAHNNLANFLDDMGRPDEAFAEYQKALELNPRAPLAHDNLGTLLTELGRFDEAMNEYAQAARLDSSDPRPHYLTGKALLKQGRDAEAIPQFREALRLDPDDFQSLTFLARVLASDEDEKIRDGAQAVALAERANELTGGAQPFVLETLAMAYAENSRFNDAQQTEQNAVRLAEAANLKETNEMELRLQLYKTGRPWRESFKIAPKK